METTTWTLPPDFTPDRLDRALAALASISRGEARRRIEVGGVYVNGSRCLRLSAEVGPGAEIESVPGAVEASERGRAILAATPPEVIFRDRCIAVLNKPPGLPVLATRQALLGTLESWIREQGPRYVAFHHRLDREAQGLIVAAIDKSANRELAAIFSERRARRSYRVLVEGHLEGEGVWEHGLVKRGGERRAVKAGVGKLMRSRWRVLENLGDRTVVEVRLETGRTHQIRMQTAAEGHPIVGDRLYGTADPGGLRLQACRLELPHPTRKGWLSYSLPDPWASAEAQAPEAQAPEAQAPEAPASDEAPPPSDPEG